MPCRALCTQPRWSEVKASQPDASVPTDAQPEMAGADDGASDSASEVRFAKLRRGLLIVLLILVSWSIAAAAVGVARGLADDPVDPLNPTSPISGSSTDG